MIVTPDQVAKYEQSEKAVKARNLFDLVGSTDHVVYQNDYCTMRDHLFCIIHFANGPGFWGEILKENPPINVSNRRNRNITWFNPPFSINVTTNRPGKKGGYGHLLR